MKVSSIILFAATLLIACEDPLGLTYAVNDSNDSTYIQPSVPTDWCPTSTCWNSEILACRDSTMIANFTRNGGGWTGGDATYSISLPDDRTLWLFGDSFIDQVNPDRSRPSFMLINNCLVEQDGNIFTTYQGGTSNAPKAFAIPPDGTSWYWPGHGKVQDDTLYLFMHAFGTGGGGMWDFFRTGIDLLKLDPITFDIYSNERVLDGSSVSYGAHVMSDGSYTYIYGVLAENPIKYAYVARANERLEQPWEYYSSGEWVEEEALATSIHNEVSEQFTVFKYQGRYYLLTQHNIFGSQIYIYSSDSPVGPWSNKRTVYCTPETGGDLFTYNAYAHPQFLDNGELLVSYNINSFDFNDLLESADNYRPYFVRISNWDD